MRHLDLPTHRHGVCELKREQIDTYEAKNKSVTSEVGPIVLIAGGWGRIGRAVRPSWMSPWHTHANISTETQHISSSCITNLLPRKHEDAKKEKKNLNYIQFWDSRETPERDFKSAWEGNGNWASNYRFSTNSFLFPGYSVCSRHCLPAILCLPRYKCQTSVKRESERAFLEWRRGGR